MGEINAILDVLTSFTSIFIGQYTTGTYDIFIKLIYGKDKLAGKSYPDGQDISVKFFFF